MGRSWVIPFAVIAAAMMLTVMVPVGEASASSSKVVFSTDFEGVGFFITAWEPLGWSRGDYAAGHGDDLWCRANSTWLGTLSSAVGYPITAHSSQSALYGAKLGTNSENGAANINNGYPDPGMDSWVRFTPPNAASYDGMTLTFWYWARTQSADYQGELTDYLCVNINDGKATTTVWKQPSPDSNGWQMASIELPAGTEWMEWEFKTGASTGAHYPGVLIDDVTVTTSSDVSAPPTSKVGSMSAYYDQRDVQVPVTMSDAESLALYYRTNGGAWTMYTDDAHPDGLFTAAPITFQAPSDGRYELFSIARNAAGTESMKSTAEASFYVDTAPPTVSITAPKQGAVYNSGSLTMNWAANDQGSGIARTEISVDGGSWTTALGTSRSLGTLKEGMHTAAIRVTDHAGSTSEAIAAFVVDPDAPAMTVSPIGSGAPLNTTIVASFHEAVAHDSVTIAVDGLTGGLTWSGDNATFVPSSPLEANRTYNATVSGSDAGGQKFSVDWSFTTVNDAGSISGTVHGANDQAVPNATVTLSNGAVTTTDAAGHFKLDNVAPGSYTLTVAGEGYEKTTREVTVTAGQAVDLGILSVSAASGSVPAFGLPLAALLLAAVVGLSAMVLVVLRKRSR